MITFIKEKWACFIKYIINQETDSNKYTEQEFRDELDLLTFNRLKGYAITLGIEIVPNCYKRSYYIESIVEKLKQEGKIIND